MIYLLSNPFTKLLYDALVYLHSFVSSSFTLPDLISPWAVALAIIAIAVKLVTYPLTAKQQRSMKGMQVIQPELKKLQEQYKDDRETLAAKQMELYREHGVNPLGGCLPLIIQMFVLFGLYRAVDRLANEVEPGLPSMKGERFAWIPDLSLCEPSPLCGAETADMMPAIPILIIMMVISQVFYQKMMTPATTSNDPQAQMMQQMMKYMPYMFAFIFAKLAAGLVLYYTMFNILGVVQHALVGNKNMQPATATAGVASEAQVPEGEVPYQERKLDEHIQRERRKRKKK